MAGFARWPHVPDLAIHVLLGRRPHAAWRTDTVGPCMAGRWRTAEELVALLAYRGPGLRAFSKRARVGWQIAAERLLLQQILPPHGPAGVLRLSDRWLWQRHGRLRAGLRSRRDA